MLVRCASLLIPLIPSSWSVKQDTHRSIDLSRLRSLKFSTESRAPGIEKGRKKLEINIILTGIKTNERQEEKSKEILTVSGTLEHQ